MSDNSFGALFRVTTWGESHGPAIGCVVDGCPPQIALSEALIQPWLDLRRPGQSAFTTTRNEPDRVRILSGVFQGKTTGTPLSLVIENTNQRSKDYENIAQAYRPGHADLTYDLKYGFRDYRGGGRSSARETAVRVAAGAIARLVLGNQIKIRGALIQIGDKAINRDHWSWQTVKENDFFCPDRDMVACWREELASIRKSGSSIGAIIEIVAENVPAGLGAPIYGKLDADIARAMMSINAVKGVEIGEGFAVSHLRGEENADSIFLRENKLEFASNHAGGILGGISTGQPIVVRFAVKPTSSILIPQDSIDAQGNATKVVTKGRHDPCVGIRAVPVGEAMMACVLADHWLRHRGQIGQFRSTVA
ncbi:Chorismate synthase [Commensalibacter sp. Nvir]|uniref:chorismate synthase n=1 Tax=Commensalibacter sp. Nvir TaxID=3069817 RepID=UPI002D6A3034|nr:Chorismate synthase [Commensalibacter sp. Nvir]